MTAHDEVALSRAPELRLAIPGNVGEARVRLDVSLVHRAGGELALHDHIGFGEACFHIALGKFDALGYIRWFFRLRLDAHGNQIIMQQRRVRLHGVHHVDNVRQHFVLDLDKLQRFAGYRLAGRGNGGEGVTFVKNLLPGHDVTGNVPVVHHHLARRHHLRREIANIVSSDNGLHAFQCLGLRGIDR